MKKINFSLHKTLELKNVIQATVLWNNENLDFNIYIEQIQSYIKTKGVQQIGPLIHYTRTFLNENDEMDFEVVIMLQCNSYIHNVEPPYSIESVIRVPNAIYCRYIGPEDKLHFAYDKINLEAFENDIELEDCNYTVFVDRNEDDETIVADVFIPRKGSI